MFKLSFRFYCVWIHEKHCEDFFVRLIFELISLDKSFYLENENLILKIRRVRLDWIKLFLNIASSVV